MSSETCHNFKLPSSTPATTTMASRSTPLLFFLIALSLVSYIQAASFWGMMVAADKQPKQSFVTRELQNAKTFLQNTSGDLQDKAVSAKEKAENLAKDTFGKARQIAEDESKRLTDLARDARDKATEKAGQLQADAKKSAKDMTDKAKEQSDKLLADTKNKSDDILNEGQKQFEKFHAQAKKALQNKNRSTATAQ
jgi:hypothetical protein